MHPWKVPSSERANLSRFRNKRVFDAQNYSSPWLWPQKKKKNARAYRVLLVLLLAPQSSHYHSRLSRPLITEYSLFAQPHNNRGCVGAGSRRCNAA
eukprot:2308614-Prymnesium_polylepis.1